MPVASVAAPPSIPALTGLRFVAAMLVFVSHYPVPGVEGTALRIMQSGYMGVTLFFVLSGFVLTYNYLDRLEAAPRGTVVRDFLVARFARIYPLYALLILFAWLQTAPGQVPLWPYLLAVQTWHPDVYFAFGLVPPSWSIGVEVFLYLAFPLLVPLAARLSILRSARRLALATAVVCVAIVGLALWFALTGRGALPTIDPASAHRWLYRTPVTRLGDFLLGMFAAIYCMRFAADDRAVRSRWRMAALGAAVAIVALMAWPANFFSSFSWDAAYALPAAIVFVGLTLDRDSAGARLLGARPMLLLGESSYAFYLLHKLAEPWHQAAGRGMPADLLLYLVFALLVAATAIGIHIAFERPARRFIRSMLAHRAGARSAVRGALPG
jgi:peptidoglycan/LPS O-acetylase OafA/YrhL